MGVVPLGVTVDVVVAGPVGFVGGVYTDDAETTVGPDVWVEVVVDVEGVLLGS